MLSEKDWNEISMGSGHLGTTCRQGGHFLHRGIVTTYLLVYLPSSKIKTGHVEAVGYLHKHLSAFNKVEPIQKSKYTA